MNVVVKVYGFRSEKSEIMEAVELNRRMVEVLKKTKSEVDGKPLSERATIVFVTSFILAHLQERREYYMEVLAGEHYNAHEVVRAFLDHELEIAKSAVFIEAHEIF